MKVHYKSSLIFVLIITVIGFLMQFVIGNIDFKLLHSPVNIILGLLIVLSIIAFSLFRENKVFKWFTGIPFSVVLISSILFFCLMMGLIPQYAKVFHQSGDVYSLLGLRNITSSWPFVLLYLTLLLSLGSLTAKRLIEFKIKDYAFYLNHIGLWILLFSSGLGIADIRKLTAQVEEGQSVTYAYTDNETKETLPFSIRLYDFSMEEYPPKIVLVEMTTGSIFPEGKPAFYQIDEGNRVGTLVDWQIELLQYLPHAVRTEDGNLKNIDMPGASEAAMIRAINRKTNQELEGWLYRGNSMQAYVGLTIDSSFQFIIIPPEPKKFTSDLEVVDGENVARESVEVNKPLRFGAWTIYQYAYDNKMGRMSQYSTFQLVYDPWIGLVYVGISILALGSVCLLWSGRKKKENNDVE